MTDFKNSKVEEELSTSDWIAINVISIVTMGCVVWIGWALLHKGVM